MSVTVTISVLDVLKSFFGTFLLSTGGAVIGLVGGLGALAMLGGGGSGAVGAPNGAVIPMLAVPVGFLLGSAVSVYLFGWMGLLSIPAVLLAIGGIYLYIVFRK